MALFVARQATPLDPGSAWARLTDWPRHGRWVPLTTVTVTTSGPNRVGTVFVARTGVGPLGFDDPMEIVEWTPPRDGGVGRCRLVKRGRVMLGEATLEVAPTPTGAAASWTEQIRVAHLPRAVDPVTALSSRLLFTRVLRRLLDSD